MGLATGPVETVDVGISDAVATATITEVMGAGLEAGADEEGLTMNEELETRLIGALDETCVCRTIDDDDDDVVDVDFEVEGSGVDDGVGVGVGVDVVLGTGVVEVCALTILIVVVETAMADEANAESRIKGVVKCILVVLTRQSRVDSRYFRYVGYRGRKTNRYQIPGQQSTSECQRTDDSKVVNECSLLLSAEKQLSKCV